jgi:hypothetical protein
MEYNIEKLQNNIHELGRWCRVLKQLYKESMHIENNSKKCFETYTEILYILGDNLRRNYSQIDKIKFQNTYDDFEEDRKYWNDKVLEFYKKWINICIDEMKLDTESLIIEFMTEVYPNYIDDVSASGDIKYHGYDRIYHRKTIECGRDILMLKNIIKDRIHILSTDLRRKEFAVLVSYFHKIDENTNEKDIMISNLELENMELKNELVKKKKALSYQNHQVDNLNNQCVEIKKHFAKIMKTVNKLD